MKKTQNILWGIALIAIGLIVGLNAMGITDINIFFKGWWTLFIIVPSFIGLFRKDGGIIWNLVFLIIGVALLLASNNILQFSMIGKLIFPFILVVVGISILFRDTFSKKISENIKKLNSDKTNSEAYTSTFSGQKLDFNGKEFNGANFDSVFGGIEVDLRDCIMSKDQLINATAIFGGIEIRVPKNINIQVKQTGIFGGTSNETNSKFDEKLPTLFINSNAIFGGVEIK